MKILKKGLLALLIMGAVTLGAIQSVNACSMSPGCASELKSVQCGVIPVMVPGSHTCTHFNGYTHQCAVMETRNTHTISCSGCKAAYPDEVRTCARTHGCDYCSQHGTVTGLCQY